jgi:hypothetical protein
VTTVTSIVADLLRNDITCIEDPWLMHVVAEIARQRFEDSFHRPALVVADKMLNILKNEGRWDGQCDAKDSSEHMSHVVSLALSRETISFGGTAGPYILGEGETYA